MELLDYVQYFPKVLDDVYCDYAVNEMNDCDKFELVFNKNYDSYGIDKENELKHLYFPIVDSILSAKDMYLERIDINQRVSKWEMMRGGVDFFQEFGERMRVQHHRKGDSTPKHIDNSITRNTPTGREDNLITDRGSNYYGVTGTDAKITVVLYLNDDYEGGKFYMADPYKEYTTEKGSALVMPSGFMYPHGVNEVTEGERWSISAFLR